MADLFRGGEEDSEFFFSVFDSPATISLPISLVDVSSIYSMKEAIRNGKPVTRTESSLCQRIGHQRFQSLARWLRLPNSTLPWQKIMQAKLVRLVSGLSASEA